jgi:hypothetical protein
MATTAHTHNVSACDWQINGNTGASKADDQFPPAEIGASTLIFE